MPNIVRKHSPHRKNSASSHQKQTVKPVHASTTNVTSSYAFSATIFDRAQILKDKLERSDEGSADLISWYNKEYYVDLDKSRACVPFYAEQEKQFIEDLEDEQRVQKGLTPGSMRASNGELLANVDPLWIFDMITVHNDDEQKAADNDVRVLSMRGSPFPSREATPVLRCTDSNDTLPVPLFLPTAHIAEEDEDHCSLEALPEADGKPRSILHSSHFGPSKALDTVPFLPAPAPAATADDIPELPEMARIAEADETTDAADAAEEEIAVQPLPEFNIVVTDVQGAAHTVDPALLAEEERQNDRADDDEEVATESQSGSDPYKSRRPRGVLFLGGWKQSYGKWPRKHKIGLIVNCARIPDIMAAGTEERMAEWVADSKKLESEGVKYHRLPWYDNPKQRLWEKTPWDVVGGAVMAVHKALSEEKNVLVHCRKGRSRSATVVIAYLMARHGFGRTEALNWVKDRRPSVNPNSGFMQQLVELQKSPMMVFLRERIGMDFLPERERYLARKEKEKKEKEDKKEKEKEEKKDEKKEKKSRHEQEKATAQQQQEQCASLAHAQQAAMVHLEDAPIASPDAPNTASAHSDVCEDMAIAAE